MTKIIDKRVAVKIPIEKHEFASEFESFDSGKKRIKLTSKPNFDNNTNKPTTDIKAE
jgi:hypothetical protein